MIRINDKWGIDSDGRNFILLLDHERTEGNKAGEHYWSYEGYYSSMDSAIQALLKYESMDVIAGDREITLTQAIEEIRDLKNYLSRQIREAVGKDT